MLDIRQTAVRVSHVLDIRQTAVRVSHVWTSERQSPDFLCHIGVE